MCHPFRIFNSSNFKNELYEGTLRVFLNGQLCIDISLQTFTHPFPQTMEK